MLLPCLAGQLESRDGPDLSPGTVCSITGNGCAAVLIFRAIGRPRLLSVSEAATELKASEAYVRRLLIRERLYGIKIGPVWAIFPSDLEAFKRTRRPPGRPPKLQVYGPNQAPPARVAGERIRAGTDRLLRKRRRQPGEPRRTGTPAG